MSVEKYAEKRAQFVKCAAEVEESRSNLRRVGQLISRDPFSFSFTENGNLMADHSIDTFGGTLPPAEDWRDARQVMDLVNKLDRLRREMVEAYGELSEEVRKVVENPSELIKNLKHKDHFRGW